MTDDFEFYIWHILLGAKEDLVYCKEILKAARTAKRDYSPTESIDSFYMTVCNLSFHNALLNISSLLDNRDKRPITFHNWKICQNNSVLQDIRNRFTKSNLQTIRDQIVAHQDASIASIGLIMGKRSGIFDDQLITELSVFLEELIELFCNLKPNGRNYHPITSFRTNTAYREIHSALEQAKPKFTGNILH